MNNDQIRDLEEALRTCQEIYDICKQNKCIGKYGLDILIEIANKADYARNQISKVLK